MAVKNLKLLINLLLVYSNKNKLAGFTLIELLVALLIAGLIISALLSLVIDLLQVDSRETARTETQREMQMALNYITSELREAVYVYDGNCIQSTVQGTAPTASTPASPNYCPGLQNYLPTFTGQTPVLAFWKPQTIPDDKLPATCTGTTSQECNDLKIKRRTYTLVVYLQSTDSSDNKWQGKSRITRYALTRYNNLPTELTKSTGYVDPSLEDSASFQTWPRKTSNNTDLQNGVKPLASNAPDVLVDFVDAPNATGVTVPACEISKNYIPSPKTTVDTTTTTASSNSFFACVRTAVPTTASITTPTGINQDVTLYLRGNANGRPGVNSDSFRPVLQTQVLVRGVINKIPE
ncbi:MAG: prepilin-type N-terminal cleavage/methylation domain-containing protein [Goleter apudmare HA4340-LM2]|jgi:prepilin-type N-terminal cleavage/methylation domain-containing protein|nr:prepilin-type N-terminal cleavage/methylation domain-containing protein [Goleter apudmare HA4340-LM2]